MTELTDLMRPDLRELAAYRSARSEAEGFKPEIGIDANEFPWPPFGFAADKCALNRYPDPQPAALAKRLAALWQIKSENLLISRGSDEGIDTLIRLFCRANKDQIMICPPTYGMYQIAAKVQGAEVLRVPLTTEAQLDLNNILKACTPNTKLIFIPSPNAPMGHMMRREDILALCNARKEKSLIVVDEAYIEFSNTPEGMLPEILKTPNLVVLRTLSKAHALAGERIGVVIGVPELIQSLLKILAPYPLTQTSIRSALDTLSPNGLAQNLERRKILLKERDRMAKLLLQSPWIESVCPSVANFLLTKTKDASAVMAQLKRFGILARDRSGEIQDAVRFSIGTPKENNLVLQALGVEVPDDISMLTPRLFTAHRETKETLIDATVNLDAPNSLEIDTGLGFFDHMLEQIALHGGFGLTLRAKGDLHIDPHHTIEDCGLTLGEAIQKALGDKRGVGRYGFTTPLDEALAQIALDLSGRPCFVLNGTWPEGDLGEMPCEMGLHFFQSFAQSLGAAIHLTVSGDNAHHIVEASFKALGRALRQAIKREGHDLPSTKGTL